MRHLPARLAPALALGLCSTAALAQDAPAVPPPPGQTADASPASPTSPTLQSILVPPPLPPAPPDSTRSVPPAPPLPPAPPPPPQAPAAKKADASLVRIYAIIKPTVIVASDAVESVGQPNASSITAAANPVLAAVRGESRYTFQAAQSRFGVWFNENEPLRGQLEFDFTDNGKASPTLATVPRLRLAKVEWQLRESLLLIAGQDWDLHAPIAPHGFNIVGAGFQAGNTAAFRQQAVLLTRAGPFELAGAVGFPGNNNGPKDRVPEYAKVPSFVARVALMLGAAGRVGVSAIGSRWRFEPDQPNERRAWVGSAAAFGDVTPLKDVNVRFEGYVGRDVFNLGLFGLGQGNANDDIDEAGGFASLKYTVVEGHALYGVAGSARVLNPSKVVPSYSYATAPADGSAPAPSSAAVAGTGPGMRWNRMARLGYEYRHSKALAVVVEGFWFRSRHVLNAEFDAPRFEPVRTAVGTEFGLLFKM